MIMDDPCFLICVHLQRLARVVNAVLVVCCNRSSAELRVDASALLSSASLSRIEWANVHASALLNVYVSVLRWRVFISFRVRLY